MIPKLGRGNLLNHGKFKKEQNFRDVPSSCDAFPDSFWFCPWLWIGASFGPPLPWQDGIRILLNILNSTHDANLTDAIRASVCKVGQPFHCSHMDEMLLIHECDKYINVPKGKFKFPLANKFVSQTCFFVVDISCHEQRGAHSTDSNEAVYLQDPHRPGESVCFVSCNTARSTESFGGFAFFSLFWWNCAAL